MANVDAESLPMNNNLYSKVFIQQRQKQTIAADCTPVKDHSRQMDVTAINRLHSKNETHLFKWGRGKI